MRLTTRLAVTFFVPAVLVVSLAAATALLQARAALRESAYEQLRAATAVRQAQLDRWIESQAHDLNFLSTLPGVRIGTEALARGEQNASVDTLAAVLQRAVGSNQYFTRLVILSAIGGRVVASTDPTRLGEYRVTEQHFLLGRSRPVVQNVYPSPSNGQPTLTLAVPVRDGRGRTLAVLAGDANLTQVEDVVSERAGLGRTGEAYLVDRYHEFVRGAGYGTAQYRRGVHTPIIDAAVAGTSGAGQYRNYAGVDVIGVYRWIPDRQLALFAEMHTEEAFAPARRLAWAILATGLLASIALALGAILLARQIASPVRDIAAAAQAVAAGDLSATAPVRTADEVGELAIAFNAMTTRLRALYGELQTQLRATGQAAQVADDGWRLLRAVLDKLPALVVVHDLEGRQLVANRAFRQFNQRRASAGHHDPRTAAYPAPASDASAPTHDGGAVVGEEIIAVADEEKIFLVARFSLRDAAGTSYAFCAVATDITERKRLEQQVLHQQKLEAIGRLAGGVAHDFNNLLTAVRCNVELLVDGMATDDPHREPLEEIDRSVRNGAALTRQLLTFSRSHVVKPTAVDIGRIVEGMSTMLRRYVGAGIEMTFELSPDLWMVHADGGQLEQVLLNLLSNAHDAMPAGGVTTVTTANVVLREGDVPQLPAGEYVRLAVRDSGTGISPDHLPLLFEPFFTTKDAGRGTGLGLSTAYAIVEQSRGAIVVESVLQQGTTFAIYLPRRLSSQYPSADVTGPALPAPVSRGGLLLLVDDDRGVRTPLRRMLVRLGYEVIEAESGDDALAQFETHGGRIVLVITDVFMPGMSGQELAARLRVAAPALPVVFMSGYTADEIGRRGLMESATHFLQKPFERAAVIATIERFVVRPEPGTSTP